MDGVYDVTTKDGYLVRVKPMAIAEKRIQTSQQQAIRKVMNKVITENAINNTLGKFIHNMVYGDLPNTIFKMCKPIYPIKRIEIRKSQILKEPSPSAKKRGAKKAAAELTETQAEEEEPAKKGKAKKKEAAEPKKPAKGKKEEEAEPETKPKKTAAKKKPVVKKAKSEDTKEV